MFILCRALTDGLVVPQVVLCTISMQLNTPLTELPPRLRESILYWLQTFSKHRIRWIASSMVPQNHLLIIDVILQAEAFQAIKAAGVSASVEVTTDS